ncbi:DUF427 domain-containing protein [Nocardia sp. NPDC020380]|uniref:DUF427 domain-containing protein n=1 Tax=Nocardia sp. NPDC020380 TaxID=3364309 RepID=UPI0037BA0CD4
MAARQPKIPGPDHPITVEKTGRRVVVRVGETVLADTTGALTLQEANYPAVQYVPLADIDSKLLTPTDTQTYCPYKGDASYYTISLPDRELTDAVWFYKEPYDSVAEIAGHAAFYTDRVEVVVDSK